MITNPLGQHANEDWTSDNQISKISQDSGAFRSCGRNANGYLTDYTDQDANQRGHHCDGGPTRARSGNWGLRSGRLRRRAAMTAPVSTTASATAQPANLIARRARGVQARRSRAELGGELRVGRACDLA
jgi:hypothetical protein